MAPRLQARNGFTMTRLPWVAGIHGGFALVIGIDRGHNGDALRLAGAHLVVHDLAELVPCNLKSG
jgi:hypothetical protein